VVQEPDQLGLVLMKRIRWWPKEGIRWWKSREGLRC